MPAPSAARRSPRTRSAAKSSRRCTPRISSKWRSSALHAGRSRRGVIASCKLSLGEGSGRTRRDRASYKLSLAENDLARDRAHGLGSEPELLDELLQWGGSAEGVHRDDRAA